MVGRDNSNSIYVLLHATRVRLHQAVFEGDQYKVAINSTGKYEAACNIFHIMEGYSSSAGVPYNRVAIQHVTDHVFPSPKETKTTTRKYILKFSSWRMLLGQRQSSKLACQIWAEFSTQARPSHLGQSSKLACPTHGKHSKPIAFIKLRK